ncbi:hypothetical protein D8Y22_17175 [Salinadaptatus halalkaliphilus]|uniref:EamA domain-containing protein n=1 Tax=Salinadaptatus halalkaliphilus TaxID=2419781 RepID=A0A4S3TKT4_9EURY|nr:EamA family transporter [Salinadaptatus halalkaliphilus]THE63555.1 hypothetical protein D8Y22_17175 [Salinadaptatus halalkaliphilus]
MIATWLVYAILTAAIYAGIALLLKVISGTAIDDPVALLIYTCVPFYAVYVAAGPVLEWTAITGGSGAAVPTTAVVAAIGIGVVSTLAYGVYYWGLVVGDVSRFVPVLAIETVFVLILGALALGESFPTGVYVGIGLVVAGALFISIDRERDAGATGFGRTGRPDMEPSVLAVALLAAVAFAVFNTGMKALTANFGTWELLFWISLGGLLSVGAAIPFRTDGRFRPRVDPAIEVGPDTPISVRLPGRAVAGTETQSKTVSVGALVLVAGGLLNALALFTFIRALQYGPVSLATAITKLDVMLVFVGALSLSKLAPELLSERFNRFTLLQKGTASAVILVGCVLIQFAY